MRNRPSYAISSVDSALLLATLLQQEGPLRVTDAAERLDVSASTAHRLLSMLVYRDFAEQRPDRSYGPGPVLTLGPQPQASVARLRQVALPHLRRLVDDVGETANLTVLTGALIRFVATVECDQVLRVGDRTGRTLPAHLSSGGKVCLALDPHALDQVRPTLDEAERDRLDREVAAVRRHGYAVNDRRTEDGLTAVGVAVPAVPGLLPTSVSLAMPTVRWSRERIPGWVRQLRDVGDAIAAGLAADRRG